EKGSKSVEGKDVVTGEWALAMGKASYLGTELNDLEDSISPNGFQALQDLREEGEIESDDEAEETREEGNMETNLKELSTQEKSIAADDKRAEGGNEKLVGPHRPGSSHRSRGRGAKKVFVNTRSLLKSLKYEMRSLNRDLFGDLPGRVKAAYEDLCVKQTEAMKNPHTTTFEAASDAWEHWHHISGIEEQFYFQKSRIQWLGLGDRNSRFFHHATQSRNARNTIRKIVTADGRILTSLPEIKQEAAFHFK
ncbi:hypothetical protein HID58_019111, partial [Brassica napus]